MVVAIEAVEPVPILIVRVLSVTTSTTLVVMAGLSEDTLASAVVGAGAFARSEDETLATSPTGHTVVARTMVSVTTMVALTGQFVTVGAQLVMV